MEFHERLERNNSQKNQNLTRPFLSETLPKFFSLYILLAMGGVALLSSTIAMDVLLRIVWQSSPLFIL